MPNFYSVIIGTELLNGRRIDKHFSFLNNELIKRGFEQKGSFLIKDDLDLMRDIFRLIKNDKDSVMFSFGGIGATPDDYTRAIASEIFTDGKLEYHKEGLEILKDKFAENLTEARLELVNFPIGAKLLTNPINRVPGFYLEERFFFTPGFPEMAQPMILEALDRFFSLNLQKKYRVTLKVYASEGDLIALMQKVTVEFSSLPCLSTKSVDISLASSNKILLEQEIDEFIDKLNQLKINFIKEG